MSLLSRQLLKSIKRVKFLDFNPYIVSSQIDQGTLWSEPLCMSYILNFEHDSDLHEFSRDRVLDLADNMF